MENVKQVDAEHWYLREEKGTVYGPYPVQHIRAWIEEKRIPNGYFLSNDREAWVPVADALLSA